MHGDGRQAQMSPLFFFSHAHHFCINLQFLSVEFLFGLATALYRAMIHMNCHSRSDHFLSELSSTRIPTSLPRV